MHVSRPLRATKLYIFEDVPIRQTRGAHSALPDLINIRIPHFLGVLRNEIAWGLLCKGYKEFKRNQDLQSMDSI